MGMWCWMCPGWFQILRVAIPRTGRQPTRPLRLGLSSTYCISSQRSPLGPSSALRPRIRTPISYWWRRGTVSRGVWLARTAGRFQPRWTRPLSEHLVKLDAAYGVHEARRLVSVESVHLPAAESLSLDALADWASETVLMAHAV